jgi:hypothetical protein
MSDTREERKLSQVGRKFAVSVNATGEPYLTQDGYVTHVGSENVSDFVCWLTAEIKRLRELLEADDVKRVRVQLNPTSGELVITASAEKAEREVGEMVVDVLRPLLTGAADIVELLQEAGHENEAR